MEGAPDVAIPGSNAILPPMSITATVENDTIKLPPGVHLPDGTTVTVESAEAPRAGDDFARLAGEEDALRARLGEAGRRFSAHDRLSRDEVHDRDALR